MNGNDGGWPAWLTLVVGAVGIAAAFAMISWIAPLFFGCGEVSAKECSEIVRNNGLAIAGIFAGLIGLLALHFNARRTQTDRLRLTNDTYVKAIEQLASASMEVRIGAMYALERIAHEEQRYHWPVTETLAAYIRERAPWPPKPPQQAAGLDAVAAAIASAGRAVAERLPGGESAPGEPPMAQAGEEEGAGSADAEAKGGDADEGKEAEGPNRAPTDIQTALTIIGQRSKKWRDQRKARFAAQAAWLVHRLEKAAGARPGRMPVANKAFMRITKRARHHAARTTGGEPRQIDLRHTDLRHADLREAALARALLEDANLENAILWDTNLAGANLSDANVTRANLTDANLMRANLTDAILWGATLMRANLMRANLTDSNLTGAN